VTFGLWDVFTSFFRDSLADRDFLLHTVLNRYFLTCLFFVCRLATLGIDCLAFVTVLVVTVQNLAGLTLLAVHHTTSLLCGVLAGLDIIFSTLILTKYTIYVSLQV